MALVLTSAPTSEPVTVTEAKAHLRVDGSAEDTLIASLILPRVAKAAVLRTDAIAGSPFSPAAVPHFFRSHGPICHPGARPRDPARRVANPQPWAGSRQQVPG